MTAKTFKVTLKVTLLVIEDSTAKIHDRFGGQNLYEAASDIDHDNLVVESSVIVDDVTLVPRSKRAEELAELGWPEDFYEELPL